jgi:hypothetical protein
MSSWGAVCHIVGQRPNKKAVFAFWPLEGVSGYERRLTMNFIKGRPWAHGFSSRASQREVRVTLLGAALAASVLVVGCLGKPVPNRNGSSGGGATGGRSASDPDVDPGSCDAWKVAYCNAVAACNAFESEESCKVRVGYVQCLEDAPVGDCADEMDAAVEKERCEDLPQDCGPSDIADRTYPNRACNDLYEAFCERSLFCGTASDLESCQSGLNATDPCSSFTAVLPTYDDCLAGVKELACQEQTPASCTGVLQR